MSAQYDDQDLAEQYAQRNNAPKNTYKAVEEYTLLKLVGVIKGTQVLDLACGDGNFTRRLAALEPSALVGVDESQEMIELAKKQEEEQSLGIIYFEKKVGEMGKIGSYDCITAAHLLHYSKTKK